MTPPLPSLPPRLNAELAQLRQDCAKLSQELGERKASRQADEHLRTGLEARLAAAERQLSQLQVCSGCVL